MNSRQRVEAALNHRQPDRVPLDLGATPVTGMHVSSVYKLRQALKLDPPGTPVKVMEAYQMLGEIAPDLQDLLGVDVVGLGGAKSFFGFRYEDWKPWTTFDGTPVLVPGGFRTEPEPNGDILMYPEGDRSGPASGRMPKGGFYFDTIVRQEPIDDAKLNVADNLEEFGPVSDQLLEHFACETDRLSKTSDRAIVANFGGTAFGDIALVPAPWLKNPKGIRDISEWYMSTVSRFDYVYEVFRRQCEIALANLAKIYDAVGDRVSVVFVSGTDFGTQNGPFISPGELPQALPALPPPRQRLGPPTYALEDVHSHVRLDHRLAAGHRRRGLRHPEPGAMLGGRDGPASAQRPIRRQGHVLGRRRGHPKDASVRNARRDTPASPRADRDFRPRWRIRLQHGTQRPGRHTGGEPRGTVRGGPRGALAMPNETCLACGKGAHAAATGTWPSDSNGALRAGFSAFFGMLAPPRGRWYHEFRGVRTYT